MSRSWIAVASAEHVRRGVEGGFVQVCHGKAGPLGRLLPGDHVACYSPTQSFGGGDRLQCFTALGVVAGAVERADMGEGFRPFRRAARWLSVRPAPVRPLLDMPGFALSGPNWGARLRYGLLEIDAASMSLIAAAMGVEEACFAALAA